MPEKKVHKKDEETFEPTIVEVYGDDRPVKSVSKPRDDDEVALTTELVDDEVLQTETMKSEPLVPKTEPETLKTEVVPVETKTDTEPVRDVVHADKDRKRDEAAFEEEIGHQRKAVRSVFGVGLFIFLLIFGLSGWAFYLKTMWLPSETKSEILVAQASPVPTATPTPSPTIVPLERSEMTLEIQNGSGVVGLAGKTADAFKKLGYEVPTVGNGEPVQATEVYVQQDLEDKLSILMEDLEAELKVSSIAGYLDEDATVTARIVLGD